MRMVVTMFAAVSVVALAAPAAAVTYRFDVFDPSIRQNNVPIDNDTYTFFFDSMPQPTIFNPGISFSLSGSAFYSAGVFGDYRADGQFNFLNASQFGGLDTPLNSYTGEMLYTGDEASPTFRLGSFGLSDGASIRITVDGIAPPPTGDVPEPASWAMMIAGFGMVGAGLRTRRQQVRVRAQII